MSVDLMALSAAIQHKLDDLLAGNWRLEEKDARNEVKERYLDPVSDGERRNLVRLAALPEDSYLSAACLADPWAGFKLSQAKGLVFESERGRGKHLSYGFNSAALGRLILAAYPHPVSRLEEWQQVAIRNSFSGFYLAYRLRTDGETSVACQLLLGILKQPEWLSIGVHLGYLTSEINLLLDLHVVPVPDLVASLVSQKNSLQENALQTPLHFLVHFLGYTEREEFRTLRQAVIDGLKADPARLVATALQTPLDSLAHFLDYVERVAHFLDYAEREEFRTLRQAVIDGLKADPARLVATALQTPLHFLVHFLGYTEREEFRTLRQAVIDGLKADPARLVATALQTPLDSLAHFLDYVERPDLLVLKEHVIDRLSTDESIQVLAQRANRAPMDGVLHFLKSVPFADKVVGAIDRESWDSARAAEPPTQPDFFKGLSKRFFELGRPELAEAPARAQIRQARSNDWSDSAIGIHHLSHVLRLGSAMPTEEIERFLDRIATVHFLERNYKSAKAGGLAGALYALGMYLAPELRHRFLIPALRDRLADEFASPSRDFEQWAQALALLGAYTVVGGDTDDIFPKQWPDQHELCCILDLRAPGPDRTDIGPFQAQLWCGLRTMANLRLDSVHVPADYGQRILRLWRASSARNAYYAKLVTAQVGRQRWSAKDFPRLRRRFPIQESDDSRNAERAVHGRPDRADSGAEGRE